MQQNGYIVETMALHCEYFQWNVKVPLVVTNAFLGKDFEVNVAQILHAKSV